MMNFKIYNFLAVALIFVSVSCTNEKIVEQGLPADQQDAFKEALENNDAYNAVKEQLEAFNTL